MKYNLERDVGGFNEKHDMKIFNRELAMDEVWNKVKQKSWWIMILSSDSYGMLDEIERSFYWIKPRTYGFQLMPFFDDRAVIAFAHKSCMNSKQLSAIMNKYGGQNAGRIDEKHDIIFGLIKPSHLGTYKWIEKIDQSGLSDEEIKKIESDTDLSNSIKQILLLRNFYNEVIDNCLQRERNEKYR